MSEAAGVIVAVRDGAGEVLELNTTASAYVVMGDEQAPTLRLTNGAETLAVFAPGSWLYVARLGTILPEGSTLTEGEADAT